MTLSKRKINYKSQMAYYELADFMRQYLNNNTVIICIGTDKCIGDSLGPLVGSFLKEQNLPLPVYGTLENPIHALNLSDKLIEIKKKHPSSTIIGIDACLGDISSVGEIHIRDYPIHPGKGVGKSLPEVGDISIIGIIDNNEKADFFSTRSIRLSFIFKMAKVICNGIIHCYYLNNILK